MRRAVSTVAAAAAVVAFMLAVMPVEGYVSCDANDVLPNGTSFTSSNITALDLKDCTTLDLNNNNIGDIGTAAIAEALKGNTLLASLDLGTNNIGDIGAAALAEALKGNIGLTELKLCHNNIGDIGAAALAEALKSNTALTVTELSLYNNSIGDIGARAILGALKGSTALTHLYLGSNNILCSDHGTMRIPGNYFTKGICSCSGSWSGDLCETNMPGKTALTAEGAPPVVFVTIALLVCMLFTLLANRKYIQPYRARRQAELIRRQAELKFGREHPIIVTTLGGDSYTLEDWGHCKDLKRAVQKLALESGFGDLGSFALLDNDGWTAPPADADADAIEVTSTEVDTEYGSTHRANMMQPRLLQEGNDIALTLVFNAGEGDSVVPAGAPPILKKVSETAV